MVSLPFPIALRFMLLSHVSFLGKLVDIQCAEHVTALKTDCCRFGCNKTLIEQTIREEFNNNISEFKIFGSGCPVTVN